MYAIQHRLPAYPTSTSKTLDSDDDELPHARDLARLPGYANGYASLKTKKPKRKSTTDLEEDQQVTKRGRPHGAGNYSLDDVKALLDQTEAELPLGQRGWKAIYDRYSKWAQKHGRPQRTQKSLETKFKQVC